MIIFSSSFDCDTHGKYFCLWPSLGVPFIVVLSCSHFNSYPANKKRFRNIRVWLYEGLVELNVVGT